MRDGRGGNIRTLPPRDQVQELHWNGVIARGSVMAMSRYGQFCPVAKASEILTERWTPVILRDLLAGSHRFNEIRKGVPLMSPSLLSTRLKMLEREGVIERRHTKSNGSVEYHLTPAGRELEPFVQFLGTWGQRWVRDLLHEDELDPGLLMWGIRGGIDPGVFPAGRTVIQFEFTDVRAPKNLWWLVAENGLVDLCITDPGYGVDLFMVSDLETMTRVWMGDLPLEHAIRAGGIELQGDASLRRSIKRWFRLSGFARVERPAERSEQPAPLKSAAS